MFNFICKCLTLRMFWGLMGLLSACGYMLHARSYTPCEEMIPFLLVTVYAAYDEYLHPEPCPHLHKLSVYLGLRGKWQA